MTMQFYFASISLDPPLPLQRSPAILQRKAILKLCGSAPGSALKTCWLNSPSRNVQHDSLCHHLTTQAEVKDDSKIPSFGSLLDLRLVSCNGEKHDFVCAHVDSKSPDPVLNQCLSSPPAYIHSPSTRTRPNDDGIVLTWMIAATNDEYGSIINPYQETPRNVSSAHGTP